MEIRSSFNGMTSAGSRKVSLSKLVCLGVVAPSLLLLSGCGDSNNSASTPTETTGLSCDDGLKTVDFGDPNVEVTAVRSLSAGDLLPGTETEAPVDFCLVDITVGPGSPGPEDAPSTSAGIGIEVLLPSHEDWNQRFQGIGGGVWAGGEDVIDPDVFGSSGALAAVTNGFVSSFTDTGHTTRYGDFAMNPDGSINWTLWEDFARRGVFEQTVKSQILAEAYYGEEVQYSYWNSCSTGGRQGLMLAQRHSDLFDGFLIAAPAIHWDRFHPAQIWPQIAMREDLGTTIPIPKLMAATSAAVEACEEVEGQGYINQPGACDYNPAADADLLCTGEGGIGVNGDASACFTLSEAETMNKIWYGPTYDGTVPDPSSDQGLNPVRPSNQLWYGINRGTNPAFLAGSNPFYLTTDMAALALEDPRYAAPNFQNAVSNGQNLWQTINYDGSDGGLPYYYLFNRSFEMYNNVIGTDDPDLSAVRDNGAKILMWHGQSDPLIMPGGTINYYERVMDRMGGLEATREFARLYMLPGVGHCGGSGTPGANPVFPDGESSPNVALFEDLQSWVEEGTAPGELMARTAPDVTPVSTRPMCLYPEKLTYVGGDGNEASSFVCQ